MNGGVERGLREEDANQVSDRGKPKEEARIE